MKLPNADRAVVDRAKLYDYCLNPIHPRGRHKARVFSERLGITREHTDTLRETILDAARISEKASEGEVDGFGRRFVLDLTVSGPRGDAMIRTGWIIRTYEGFPRLTTCYVL